MQTIVTCVTKNSRGKITHIGDSQWEKTVEQAIREIESHQTEFYVGTGPNKSKVIVIDDNPKYLRAVPDEYKGNNLDNLPSCP